MKADKLAQMAIDEIRKLMARCSESEEATLDVFIDQIGSEVDGWEDRKREIERDSEGE